MASSSLTSRVAAFKERMLALAKGKHSGYDELSQSGGLDAPLVGGQGYADEPGQPLGADAGAYVAPAPGAPVTGMQVPRSIASTVPNQSMELMELTHLAKEAASILWEMVALGESGVAMEEMRSRAEQLQGQLRGLIGDTTDADEQVLVDAFSAFDMLSRCLNDEEEQQPPPAAAAEEGGEQPPGAQAGGAAAVGEPAALMPTAAETEPPLIQL